MTLIPHLRALMEKATPGPIRILEDTQHCGVVSVGDGSSEYARCDFCRDDKDEANAALYVAMHDALPNLLAVVDAAHRVYLIEGDIEMPYALYALKIAVRDMGNALAALDKHTNAKGKGGK